MTLKHVLKHFNKTELQDDERFSLSPMREREELLCERSELSNSGEGCKDLPSPDRHPLPREGNKVSCAEHTVKDLSSNRPIVLMTFKKAAFTLAEVLITLGIIGIVAALTIPNLVTKYRKHVVETRLKKTYSILYNALKMSESENGNLQYPAIELWEKDTYWSGPEFSNTYIYPYLKVGSVSRIRIDAYGNRDITLADGTKIKYGVYYWMWPWNSNAPRMLGHFEIYWGNDNEKRIAGKNYFDMQFGYAQQGKGGLVMPIVSVTGEGGCVTGAETRKTDCANGTARSCANIIYCNNWRIPDDYPIKL